VIAVVVLFIRHLRKEKKEFVGPAQDGTSPTADSGTATGGSGESGED
jgi:hypothetical protein